MQSSPALLGLARTLGLCCIQHRLATDWMLLGVTEQFSPLSCVILQPALWGNFNLHQLVQLVPSKHLVYGFQVWERGLGYGTCCHQISQPPPGPYPPQFYPPPVQKHPLPTSIPHATCCKPSYSCWCRIRIQCQQGIT